MEVKNPGSFQLPVDSSKRNPQCHFQQIFRFELVTDNWKLETDRFLFTRRTAARRACAHPGCPLALLPSGPDAIRDPLGLHKFRTAVRPARALGSVTERTSSVTKYRVPQVPQVPQAVA